MRQQCTLDRRFRLGITSVLALQFLAIFAALGVAFAAVASLEAQKADNFRAGTVARLAAESGLAYATNAMKGVLVDITSGTEVVLVQAVYSNLSSKLDGTSCLAGGSVLLSGESVVSVPQISLGEG